MKRKFLFIVLTLTLSILCSSCNYKAKDSSKVSEESISADENNPIQEARELMLDWQIKKTYQERNLSYDEKELTLPISTSQAETYISQKGLLLSNNDIYKEKWGFDFSIPESEDEAALLDDLHEYLSYWMLMRENVRVLHTEKNNDDYYSMVLTLGYDFGDGIYLVRYTMLNEKIQILNVSDAPQILSLQNVYLGVMSQNNPICFGFVKKLKYDLIEDKWMDSDICKIKLLTTAEDYDIYVDSPKPFITFLPKESQVIGYKAMNSQDDVIEEKELTELDFSNPLER